MTKDLDPSQHQVLALAMFKKLFKRGEVIIKFGDIGHEYFVLYWGTCKVSVYIPGTNPSDP